MTTPEPTLTPAQVLRLVADFSAAGTPTREHREIESKLLNLDPAALRAQAEALASREREVERLRRLAQRVDAAMGVYEHVVATGALTKAILTPTPEAPNDH